MFRICVLVVFASLFGASAAYAEPWQIAGHWQHEKEPVVVNMRAAADNSGSVEGVVTSHPQKPAAVGSVLFSGLAYNQRKQCWQGTIYVPRLKESKSVCLRQSNSDAFELTVKVGFFSKTVTWHRSEGASKGSSNN